MSCQALVLRARALFLLLFLVPLAASASIYNTWELQSLQRVAEQKGYVSVIIGIVNSPYWQPTPEQLTDRLAKRDALLAELGAEMLTEGFDTSARLGVISTYVTAKGLTILAASSNVGYLGTGFQNSAVDDGGRFAAIDAEIDRIGVATVAVNLNLDSFDFDFAADGSSVYRPSPAQDAEFATVLPTFLAALPQRGIVNRDRLDVAAAQVPTVYLTVRRDGFYTLQQSKLVRALRLAGSRTQAPLSLDREVLRTAAEQGQVDVMLSLQGGDFYSNFIAGKAMQTQTAANQRAIDAILAPLGTGVLSHQDMPQFRGAVLRLDRQAITQLYANPDPRIQAVELNRVVSIDPPPPVVINPSGGLAQATLSYSLTLPSYVVGKRGDIFVAFHQADNEGAWWLLGSDGWRPVDATAPAAYFSGTLAASLQANILPTATDLRSLVGGQFYVGYGVRSNDAASVADAWQDMSRNMTVMAIWAIMAEPASAPF